MLSLKIIKNYRTPDIYSKILRYITLEIVIVIAAVSIALYYSFIKIQISDIYSSSKDSVSEVSYSTNFMVSSAKSLLSQLSSDENVSLLRYYTDVQQIDIDKAIRMLKNYNYTMPFVDSIYVYNARTDTFYSTLTNNNMKKSSEFVDQDIMNILKNYKEIDISKPYARKVMVSNSSGDYRQYTNVFTFILKDSSSSEIDNAIIVNVSELWVRQVINSLNSNKGNSIYVLSDKGQIVSSANDTENLSYVSNTSYFKHIMNSKNPLGYFIDDFNGKKSLITYVSTQGLDWKFIRVTPYSIINKKLSYIRNNTLIICLIILCFGLFASYILSKKVYKPIDDVIIKLKNLSDEKSKAVKPLKDEFLRALILNENSFDLNVYNRNIVDYNIKILSGQNICMTLLKIDNFSDFCFKFNNEDRSLLKFGIMNIATELFEGLYSIETLDIGRDHVILFFNEEVLDDSKLSQIDTILKEIQNNVEKLLNISVSCAFGPEGYNVSDISKLYMESLDISNYRTFFGHKSIIFLCKLDIKLKYVYPIDYEKSLIDSFLMGKTVEEKRIYDIIVCEGLTHYHYSNFNSTMLRLAFSISSVIETIEKAKKIKIDYSFSEFIGRFKELETLAEYRNHFFNMFDELSNMLEQKKIFKHDELIDIIIGIISSNFMDGNLCLDNIAGMVNMSPVYLGRLFKKNVLKSVSDYINDMRMEKAIELLDNTTISINEIVDRVGFSNRSYFHTLFKRNYGTTPTGYRKNLNNGDKTTSK